PERAQHFLVHAPLHVLEETEALALVLDKGIALAVAAQADPFLQMVEAVKVILPLAVDDLQHDVPLDAAHELGAEELRLVLVTLDDAVPESVTTLTARQPIELDAVQRFAFERKDTRHFLTQRRQIPRLDVG